MFYSKLTVYKFDKNKLKVDYSTIPVRVEDGVYCSEVSEQRITFEKPFCNRDGACTVMGVFEEMDEKRILAELSKMFNKHFWYKLRYRSHLKKKLKEIKGEN